MVGRAGNIRAHRGRSCKHISDVAAALGFIWQPATIAWFWPRIFFGSTTTLDTACEALWTSEHAQCAPHVWQPRSTAWARTKGVHSTSSKPVERSSLPSGFTSNSPACVSAADASSSATSARDGSFPAASMVASSSCSTLSTAHAASSTLVTAFCFSPKSEAITVVAILVVVAYACASCVSASWQPRRRWWPLPAHCRTAHVRARGALSWHAANHLALG